MNKNDGTKIPPDIKGKKYFKRRNHFLFFKKWYYFCVIVMLRGNSELKQRNNCNSQFKVYKFKLLIEVCYSITYLVF